jgi:hypothetical protein
VFAAYVAVTIVTILANASIAVADLARARFVLANMDEVRVPRPWLPRLAVLKGAAAVGLLLGLAGVRPLGIAAAIGLVLFFTGALAAHVRTRVFHNIAVPAAFFALAAASAGLAILRLPVTRPARTTRRPERASSPPRRGKQAGARQALGPAPGDRSAAPRTRRPPRRRTR